MDNKRAAVAGTVLGAGTVLAGLGCLGLVAAVVVVGALAYLYIAMAAAQFTSRKPHIPSLQYPNLYLLGSDENGFFEIGTGTKAAWNKAAIDLPELRTPIAPFYFRVKGHAPLLTTELTGEQVKAFLHEEVETGYGSRNIKTYGAWVTDPSDTPRGLYFVFEDDKLLYATFTRQSANELVEFSKSPDGPFYGFPLTKSKRQELFGDP